jgi:hypothetical protein
MAYSIFNRFLFNQPNFKYFWLNLMKNDRKYKICSDRWRKLSNGNYKMLCVNLSEVSWYMRNESAIEHINAYKHNPN